MIPKSWNQALKPAKNAQTDFSSGVYNDGLAQSVPSNGLYYATNAIPYPDGKILGRIGNKLWANTLPKLYTGITASKSGTTITITGGHTLDGTEQGMYFGFAADGKSFPILSVNIGAQTITTLTSAAYTSVGACFIREEVNAREWHKFTEKWVLQIGNYIYTAAYSMAAWTRVYCSSYTDLAKTKSEMKIFDENAMIIYNANGVFYLNLVGNAKYYKMNTSNPVDRAADSGSGAYKYYYLASYSLLSTVSHELNRRDSGVVVIHESGTNNVDTDCIDYTEILDSAAVAADNAQTIALKSLSTSSTKGEDLHWTHYSLYRTLDVGINGKNAHDNSINSIGQFYHVDDVPIVKSMNVKRSGTKELTVARGYGVPQVYDIGATIRVWDTSNVAHDYTISAITDNLIETVENLDGGISATAAVASIGGYNGFICTSTGANVLYYSVGHKPTAAELGKSLFFANNQDPVIITAVNTSTGDVTVDRTIATATYYCSHTPIGRTFYDATTDAELRVRSAFFLKQRYFLPVDNWTIGACSNGFIVGAISGNHDMQYSETGNKEWAGYYNSGLQYDHVEDQILAISVVNDVFVVYCKENIFVYDTKDMTERSSRTEDPTAGTQLGELPILVFNGRVPIKGTGIYDRGALQKDKNGNDMFLTNKNEIVVFNGSQLSENMIAGRIMKKITKLQRLTSSAYSRTYGYLLFGTEAQSS